jgi:hypothetical protein
MQTIAHNAVAAQPVLAVASGEGLTEKPGVLRALADLFCLRAEPDDEEIARFRELALRIIPAADPSTLIYVASRLARHPHAPPSVLAALMRADRPCALLIAEYALNLAFADQIGLARGRDGEIALALARRRGIGGDITEALVMRREPAVLDALAANREATFTRAAIERIGMFARQDGPFLAKFTERAEEPLVAPQDFLRASSLERARLVLAARRAHLGKASAPVARDDALAQDLRDFAQTRKWDAFCERVARVIGWDARALEPLVKDSSGEPLALLLCALGCSHQDAVRVFLCCEAPIAHSYPRVRTLADMVRDTPPAAASGLLEAATGRGIERSAASAPQPKAETKDAPARSLPRAYTPDVRAHMWSADSVRPPRVKTAKAAPAPSRERPKAAVLLRRG